MTLRFFAVAMLIASALLTGGVAAQDGANNSTTTATATPTPTGQAAENVTVELGPTAEIVRWAYRDGTWHVTIRATVPIRVTLTDSAALFGALSEGEGARTASIPTQGYTLDAGTTTIQMPGQTQEGQAALSVAANGQLVLLRTGSMGGGRQPVAYGTAALLAGAAAIGTGWYSFRRGRSKLEESDDPEVERIA